MYVLQMQIPVTITDPLPANTGLKKVAMTQIEVVCIETDRLKRRSRYREPAEMFRLLKVFVCAGFQLFAPAPSDHFLCRILCFVRCSQRRDETVYLLRPAPAVFQKSEHEIAVH